MILIKKIKNNIYFSILFSMFWYWFFINILLIIIIIIKIKNWLLISGFNIGFSGSIIYFFYLYLLSKPSKKNLKKEIIYFNFLLRILIYGIIIILNIFFNFANIFTMILGISILMIATITAILFIYQKK